MKIKSRSFILTCWMSLSCSVSMAYDAVDVARSKLGADYGWGDEGPNSFDCSGLTQFAMGHLGVELPRRAVEQSTVGRAVDFDDIRRGDLVFFGNSAEEAASGIVGHVGIAESSSSMINAVWADSVQRDDLQRGWPKNWFITARRIDTTSPSTRFSIGDRVEVTDDDAILRDIERDWRRSARVEQDDAGVIKSLPIFFQGEWRWEVEFEDETGWVAESSLSTEDIKRTFEVVGSIDVLIDDGADGFYSGSVQGEYDSETGAIALEATGEAVSSLGYSIDLVTTIEIFGNGSVTTKIESCKDNTSFTVCGALAVGSTRFLTLTRNTFDGEDGWILLEGEPSTSGAPVFTEYRIFLEAER